MITGKALFMLYLYLQSLFLANIYRGYEPLCISKINSLEVIDAFTGLYSYNPYYDECEFVEREEILLSVQVNQGDFYPLFLDFDDCYKTCVGNKFDINEYFHS